MNIFQRYIKLGLSVIPCEMKRPLISAWKVFQSRLPTDAEAASFNGSQIACICGQVSGGLICLDFDVKNGNKYDEWVRLVCTIDPALLSKLVIEKSPSGGYHAIFRTAIKINNLKLANNPEHKATIETRGEGGYFVCYPSPDYTLEYSSFENINTLTDSETEILIQSAKSFNEIIEPEKQINYNPSPNITGLSPFDDYDSRHDLDSLLLKHGWNRLFERNNAVYYKRPGKQERSISATWNAVPGRFYVFTTSTVFENNHVYKPSAVYSILEHGGNFSQAAKALSAQGYGKIEKQKNEAQIINISNLESQIFSVIANGYPKGKSTGWQSLDKLYSVILGQFTVVTGMPSHGKSEFMDALAVNLVASNQWKFAIFSPENYPPVLHCHKLIEKICGNELRKLEATDVKVALKIISDHFFFLDAVQEDIDLSAILDQTEKLIQEKNINGLIIDPWNEIELSKPRDIGDSDFIGVCLRKIRKFARKFNIHLWIVAHPTKMQKDKNGDYPIPELYDIQGSSHWRNKADNGICVHRNFDNDTTEIYVQKIKFRYAGKPGMTRFKYNLSNGRYEEAQGSDFDNSCDRF